MFAQAARERDVVEAHAAGTRAPLLPKAVGTNGVAHRMCANIPQRSGVTARAHGVTPVALYQTVDAPPASATRCQQAKDIFAGAGVAVSSAGGQHQHQSHAWAQSRSPTEP